MSFFTNPEIAFSAKVMEIIYIFMGFMCMYTAFKNLKDKENPSQVGTFIFWFLLGIVLALGQWLPSLVSGILVVLMCLPAVFKKVAKGHADVPTVQETQANYQKIGMKIFAPTLCIGIFAILCAMTGLGIGLSALNGVAIGVVLAMIILMFQNKGNTFKVFMKDSERMLSVVGPLSMLPMLLACLGAVFTQAGVGEVIAQVVGNIIPEGNVTVGIIVYAIGMMLFTMIMGNAFAAFTVITAGIGVPFVIAQGGNPAVIGVLGMTAGYCGTLMTPMAANFNIVPCAVLETKDPKWSVIKAQLPMALMMIVVHIILMLVLGF